MFGLRVTLLLPCYYLVIFQGPLVISLLFFRATLLLPCYFSRLPCYYLVISLLRQRFDADFRVPSIGHLTKGFSSVSAHSEEDCTPICKGRRLGYSRHLASITKHPSAFCENKDYLTAFLGARYNKHRWNTPAWAASTIAWLNLLHTCNANALNVAI